MVTFIPRLGLGTSGNTDPDECARTVASALEMGYRHVDTAQMYDNESYVGDGIERADVPREEVFIATKVHPDNLGYRAVLESVEASLDRLGVSYVDLLYVHWPIGEYEATDTLPAFDELRDDGSIDHVGVSNFTPALLAEARDVLDAPIAAHQVERHPLLPQRELLAEARTDDHLLVAYSPLMQGGVVDIDVLTEIAADHDATAAQVCLAWHLADDHVAPIPKGTGDHVGENFAATDLTLSSGELERIDALEERERLIDPDAAAWNQ
ncbi:MAG: aldo/keto reductase [Halobacteriaceae archaeon]